MTGAQGLRVRVDRVDDDATRKALQQVAQTVRADLQQMLVAAGTEIVLPDARARAPKVHGISASLTVRAARSGRFASLTTTHRGKLSRLVGLLEYGGTVNGFILPTAARRRRKGHRPAVMTPWGPRYIVTGPRTYQGKFFMTTAVAGTFDRFAEHVADQAAGVFAAHGIKVQG